MDMKSATYKTGILRTACPIPTLKTLVFCIFINNRLNVHA